MARLIGSLLMCALGLAGCGSTHNRGDSSPISGDRSCLSVVGWNDMHGQLGPDNPVISTSHLRAGGVAAVADVVADVRASGDVTVVVDAGDLFTGPIESTLAEGAPVLAAYRVIGVDAAAVGNHEFDFGPVGYDKIVAKTGLGDDAGDEGPRGVLLKRMREASFPFVAANITIKSPDLGKKGLEEPKWPNFHRHVLIERGGYRVGIVGYTTTETPETTLKPNVHDLDFARHGALRVAASVRELRSLGANPIVLLAHASFDGDLPQMLDDPRDTLGLKHKGELGTLLDEMGGDKPDMIVAGHRHAWMLGRIRGVPIASSDHHGVGVARFRFCRSSPKSVPAPLGVAPPTSSSPMFQSVERIVAVAHDPPRTTLGREVERVVGPEREKYAVEGRRVVAEISKACSPRSDGPNAMMDQVASAIWERAGDAMPLRAGVPVVALTNAGGIRTSLLAGPLHFSDLFSAFPFENSVAACLTNRKGVQRAIDNASHRTSVRERFPFGIAGARLVMRRQESTGFLDTTHLHIEGANQPNDPVILAIPDFLLWGGDSFLEGVVCTTSATSSTRLRDAWRVVLARSAGGCDGPSKSVKIE